jgi:hypothetical protein
MRILANLLFLWITLAPPVPALRIQTRNPVINLPRPGDVIQGVMMITGSDDVAGFVSAEISFAYSGDPTGTWFLISLLDQPVSNNWLATWDTTVITDGNYDLRLRVNLADGSRREITVPSLRVRNYTPIETPTPTPIVPTAILATTTPTSLPTITMTPSPFPTPTRMPNNPATLTPSNVYTSIIFGGLAVILAFSLIGLYLGLRRK